jgi:glycosyltransferase involved in cell wall biosynthesis
MEALAHGKAVVTSPVGSQGLEQFADEALVICQSSEDMANRILQIAGDEDVRRRLENGARKIAREEFSPDACYGPLLRALSGKAPCADAKIA